MPAAAMPVAPQLGQRLDCLPVLPTLLICDISGWSSENTVGKQYQEDHTKEENRVLVRKSREKGVFEWNDGTRLVLSQSKSHSKAGSESG